MRPASSCIRSATPTSTAITRTRRAQQLAREPRPLPRLKLGDVGSIFDLDADAIAFEGYDPWPAIKAKVAV